jgi:hypothetical protein
MKALLLFILVLAAVIAAFWLLPWWLSLILVFVVVSPLVWIAWKILSVLKTVTQAIAEVMPKKHLCSLTAGEPFRGNSFAFTFPVACEVSQTVLDDLEALILKPQIHPAGVEGESMLLVSTIPMEEMKTKTNEKLEAAFAQLPELQVDAFAPIAVGPLQGERRTLQASEDGKKVRGELVYLGDRSHSVTWQVITLSETFESVANKYRELAAMIQRVEDSPNA